ncbi:MAG: PKD domain-containing protein [Flavobacteriales bacterium]
MKRTMYSVSLQRTGFLTALCCLMLLFPGLVRLNAQTITAQVGTGTGTNSTNPITSCWGYSYTQQIYTAAEITAAGGVPGNISKLRFFFASTSSGTGSSTGWTVYMGNSTRTEFTSNTDWEPLANLNQVYTGTVTYPAAGNWLEITLGTPFLWDGVSNIVVAVDENQSNWNCTINWRVTSTTGNRAIYFRDDSNNPNPASPPTATGRQTHIPNAQFDFVQTPCAGLTPAPGNTNASQANLCALPTNSSVLTVQNNYAANSGMTYQWQSNTGAGWNNIAGATGFTYTVSNLGATTQYQCVLVCDNTNTGTSTPVTVNVHPLPVVSVSPSFATTCGPTELINLTGSGAHTYSWAPNTGLSGTTGTTVQAAPTVLTNYVVTGTDTLTGCSNRDTATVAPIQQMPYTLSYSPAANCAPGTPITISVAHPAGYVAGLGTLQYEFLDATGANSLQAWSTNAQYTFTPAADSIYEFSVRMRSNVCDSNMTPLKKISVVVGFGGDVQILNHVNCNDSTGGLNVLNAFGQGDFATWYNSDFSATPNPADATLHGVAAVTGGRMILTPSATSSRGAMTILNPAGIAGTGVEYHISFKLTADNPINTFGTGGADGIAYSFGDDANFNTAYPACSGYGTKLRISFDAAGNSSENGNNSGIYLVYGTTLTNQLAPVGNGTLAYTADVSKWKTLTDVQVDILITSAGKLTLTVGGTVIFNEVQLPSSFQTANKSNWKHVFSAHTGGDALRQGIDDVNIELVNYKYGINVSGAGVPASWQDGGRFDSLAAGSYDVYMANPADTIGCNRLLGTYTILDLNPVLELGNDTLLCSGYTLTLNAGNPGSSYSWSNGSAAQTLAVTGAGTFWVQVTDTFGCQAYDIINVTGGHTPMLDLGADTTICDGETVLLDAGMDGDFYLWQDNSANQTYSATTSGTYWVDLSNTDGCHSIDSLFVNVLPLPVTTGITAVVTGNSVAFSADNPQDVFLYEWHFGDGNVITNISPTIQYNYLAPGTYTVTLVVINQNNCGTNTVTITVTIADHTGLEEVDAQNGLHVFPNPASDFIQLANPDGIIIDRVSIFDATGKQVYMSSPSAPAVLPSVAGWTSGMYLIKIESAEKLFVQRLIIQK